MQGKMISFWMMGVLMLAGWGGAEEATYTNPVISEMGLADPTVILYEGVYYMYPTGNNVSYHVYTSTDLVHWTKGPEVFRPGGRNVWAPDVFYNKADKKFYMYYTAAFRIGVAVADKPDGKFEDRGIILPGVIDAHLFQDDDGQYYLYCTDVGQLFVQPMESPLKPKGEKKLLMVPSQPWEWRSGRVNEGPWMIKHKKTYYLLYSGSGADSRFYGVGYATADNPMGPFTKYPGNPIIDGSENVYGPGHGTVTKDAQGNLWHVYHQKKGPDIAWDRFICIDPMWFDPNDVLHGQATRGIPQPAPKCTSDEKNDQQK